MDTFIADRKEEKNSFGKFAVIVILMIDSLVLQKLASHEAMLVQNSDRVTQWCGYWGYL